jgi:ADP-heptose:LPS heptosyltransferase
MRNTDMRLLIIRTSAMGDVALTVPVIKSLVQQYPAIEVILLTKPAYKPFFFSIPNLILVDAEFKGIHEGFAGLYRLFRQILNNGAIDYVIDLHDVFRSRFLRFLFRINGSKVYIIDKGRKEKRELIRQGINIHLKHTVERYKDVLAKSGYPVDIVDGPSIIPDSESIVKVEKILSAINGLKIGVAPYAKHRLKMWPEENMIKLLNMISLNNKVKFYLFGGGKHEETMLDSFASKVPYSEIVAGKLYLEEELALISKIDFMICMDSSNMHMAALTGTKVISIWGGTHPAAGFGAVNQPDDYSIQISDTVLTCRPCTIYGTGTCKRGDLACMNWLTPEMVLEKLVKLGLIK